MDNDAAGRVMRTKKPAGAARLSRTIGFVSAEYLLRTLRNLGPAFGFDYERMIIALSVTMGNVQHLLNSPEQLAPYEDLTTIIPAELQRPVTRLAITRATGLPRETVRRKVASLIEAGILIKDERGGVRLAPGAFNSELFAAAVAQNDADVRRLVRRIRPLMGE
jgi:DNA-binding transcriptional ArsR family regulator